MDSPETKKELGSADILDIMRYLPHRYPFLLVDKITEMDEDKSAIGIKNVTYNENFFQGHFPKHPVMPGVLIIEGMAQTAGALCISAAGPTGDDQIVYFMAIDRARFRKPVMPGDQIYYHVNKVRSRGNVWRFRADARVDGETAAEAEISAMLVDIEDQVL